MGGWDFEMVERVSFQYLLTSDIFYDDNIFYRQIFPNEIGTKNKRSDNGIVDPNSIRSKAKRTRLERAKERRQQAAASEN